MRPSLATHRASWCNRNIQHSLYEGSVHCAGRPRASARCVQTIPPGAVCSNPSSWQQCSLLEMAWTSMRCVQGPVRPSSACDSISHGTQKRLLPLQFGLPMTGSGVLLCSCCTLPCETKIVAIFLCCNMLSNTTRQSTQTVSSTKFYFCICFELLFRFWITDRALLYSYFRTLFYHRHTAVPAHPTNHTTPLPSCSGTAATKGAFGALMWRKGI